MDNASQELVTKLKVLKQQGLTFYQATEHLKQQGYTLAQITNAADRFSYTGPESKGPSIPPSPRMGSEMDRNYQKMGNNLLADKERSARPYAYVGLAIPAGYLGSQIYRFFLNERFWGSHGDPHYWWANNVGWLLISGAVGAGIAVIILKIHFHSKDKRYKQIDERLSNSRDS